MVVQNPMVKGGIASVVNGYRGSALEKEYKLIYVESYKDGGKATKLLKAVCGYFHFIKVLFVDKPHLVHIHSSFGPSFYRKLLYIYMASSLNKPIINHIHGADFNEFYLKASEKKKRLIRKTYNKCTMLIALSDEWKESLSLIVPEEKITTIENYSILHQDALEQRLVRKSNNKVLFLGELGKRKGCFDIPAVAKRVIKEIPDTEFILGGSGKELDIITIQNMFQDLGVMDHVRFPGWIRGGDKDRFLRESDVFFLPSYNEGMPMSILDAMGYGLPIVSTNVGGISKIVKDTVNGSCCEVGDITALSDGIIRLLKSPRILVESSLASYHIANERFSLDKHIKQIDEVYRRLI